MTGLKGHVLEYKKIVKTLPKLLQLCERYGTLAMKSFSAVFASMLLAPVVGCDNWRGPCASCA